MSFINYIKKHIIAVMIAVLGFLSAIVTMFININNNVSIKWLIFIIFISLVCIILLLSIIKEFCYKNFDVDNIKQLKLKYLNKQSTKGEVFLNMSGINFDYGDVIKIYYLDDDNIENFIGIGIIEYLQTKENICHIEWLQKKEIKTNIKNVYFSLKINKNELFELNKGGE